MGGYAVDSDHIEPTQNTMSPYLNCLGRLIDKMPSKQLVLFIQPISNGTMAPASQSTDLSLAGRSFVQTSILSHLRSNKILLPAVDLGAFVRRYKKNLPGFSLYVLSGSFSEFKPTQGAGIGVAGEASRDQTGGRASGDWNSESARLALDVSLINVASGFTVDNVSLATAVNKNRDGFTLALGTSGGGIGLNLGSFQSDSVHAKQRALVETSVYILLARRFRIPESKCATGAGESAESASQSVRTRNPNRSHRRSEAG